MSRRWVRWAIRRMHQGHYGWIDRLDVMARYLAKEDLSHLVGAIRSKLESSEDAALARLARRGGREAFARHYPRLHRVLGWQLRAGWWRATRASISRLNKGQPMRTRHEVRLAGLWLRLSPLQLLWIWLNFHRHPVLWVYWRRRARRSGKWIMSQLPWAGGVSRGR